MFFHFINFINHLIPNISVPIALTKSIKYKQMCATKLTLEEIPSHVIILAATHRAPCIDLSFVLGTRKLPGTELMTLSCLLYSDPKL